VRSSTANRILDALSSAGVPGDEAASALGMTPLAWHGVLSGERALPAEALTRTTEVSGVALERLVAPYDGVLARYRRSLQDRADTGWQGMPVSDLAEDLARDVRVLVQTGDLTLRPPQPPVVGDGPAEAERLSAWARRQVGAGHDPIADPQAAAAALGLLLFLVPSNDEPAEAAYLRLEDEGLGIAWVEDGPQGETGRRRFSAAHELGHHLRGDDYRAEDTAERAGEAFANAFAIHFLLPHVGAEQVFARHAGDLDPRPAMLEAATSYGVSWSAVCVQLTNLGLIDPTQAAHAAGRVPTGPEIGAQGVAVPTMPARPVPTPVVEAALRAYRRRKISAGKCRGIAQDPSLPLPVPDRLPGPARERFVRPAWLDQL